MVEKNTRLNNLDGFKEHNTELGHTCNAATDVQIGACLVSSNTHEEWE
jgi:hypothetical protein